MMFQLIVVLAVLSVAFGFAPSNAITRQMSFSEIQSKFGKALGVAAMGIALAGPVTNVNADGAVSKSTVYRGRTKYGSKILDLGDAVKKGDFAAFEDKKTVNAFDLFISSSNALGGKISKEKKAAETAIEADIYTAVKAKDASKLASAYKEFIKVADLASDYKPGELGQSDSSGYSPTWGTSRQYIYQR